MFIFFIISKHISKPDCTPKWAYIMRLAENASSNIKQTTGYGMITKLFIETNKLVYLAKIKGNPFHLKYNMEQKFRVLFAIK